MAAFQIPKEVDDGSEVIRELKAWCLEDGELTSARGWDVAQKNTFTKWVNGHLAEVGKEVRDLFTDFQDGRNLLLLLEVLSGEKLFQAAEVAGNWRVHQAVQNVTVALDYLKRAGVKVK